MKNITTEAIISIALISIIIFLIIGLIRLVFYILLFIAKLFYKPTPKKLTKKKKEEPKSDITVYKKEEDQRHKDLNKEKKSEMEKFLLEGVERLNQQEPEQHLSRDFENDGKIVGIAKPVGFWTSLILGDQLSAMLGRAYALNNREHKGFWVSMLEAQARGLGRQKGHIKGGDY